MPSSYASPRRYGSRHSSCVIASRAISAVASGMQSMPWLPLPGSASKRLSISHDTRRRRSSTCRRSRCNSRRPSEKVAMTTSITRVGSALQYIPIRHTCGHFELRLTRWQPFNANRNVETRHAQGFLPAGSQCSTCAPQGRPISDQFRSLEAAQGEAAKRNAK